MAYIKIFGIKSTVKKAVVYITNPDKTDKQNLVSSYGCSPETAVLEFAMTAKLGKDNVMEKGDNLAWHMIISFKPGEITNPHIAHEVATKIADATLKGKLTDALHTVCGFETDYKFITKRQMKNIQKKSKGRE